jgi:thioredoxin-dependent peroxiredoxin
VEAREFRDAYSNFTALGAVILGVSPDSVKTHRKFKEKHSIPFTLLADEGHKVAESYGVWREKRLYGRKYLGIERTTFIIDPYGEIAHTFEKVRADGHAADVELALRRILGLAAP